MPPPTDPADEAPASIWHQYAAVRTRAMTGMRQVRHLTAMHQRLIGHLNVHDLLDVDDMLAQQLEATNSMSWSKPPRKWWQRASRKEHKGQGELCSTLAANSVSVEQMALAFMESSERRSSMTQQLLSDLQIRTAELRQSTKRGAHALQKIYQDLRTEQARATDAAAQQALVTLANKLGDVRDLIRTKHDACVSAETTCTAWTEVMTLRDELGKALLQGVHPTQQRLFDAVRAIGSDPDGARQAQREQDAALLRSELTVRLFEAYDLSSRLGEAQHRLLRAMDNLRNAVAAGAGTPPGRSG